jgi:hypothetical protein
MIKDKNSMVEAMFKVGAHFGLAKARRHPSTKQFVFGIKNKIEIFDLEKTNESLEKAKAFVASIAASGKQALFVAGKSEAITAGSRRPMDRRNPHELRPDSKANRKIRKQAQGEGEGRARKIHKERATSYRPRNRQARDSFRRHSFHEGQAGGSHCC